MLRHSFGILSAILLMAAVPAYAQETTSTANTELAVIKGKPVTEDDLSSFGMVLGMYEGRAPSKQRELLEEYILTRLHQDLYTTVAAEKHPEPPTVYPSAMQRGVIRRDYTEQLQKSIDVPREAMQEWYDANVKNYTQPEKARAYHLFLETSDDNESSSPAKIRERLKELKAQADAGTSFSQLAEQYSEASSARNGGEIGYVSPRMPIGPQNRPMNLKLEEAIFSLQPGEVSDVVETSHGMHLLYVADRTTTMTPSLDDMISSGILPQAVASDMLTSEAKKRISQAIEKFDAKVAEQTTGTLDNLTTETPALVVEGKTLTVSDLEHIYGVRFTRAFQRAAADPARLEDLLKQVLEDEVFIRSAVAAGVDKKPEIEWQLELLGQRQDAVRRLQAIMAEIYPVEEKQLRELYEEKKDQMLQPESEGEVLVIVTEETTSPAEQGRLRDRAQKLAQDAHKKIEGGASLKDVAGSIKAEDISTSYSQVERHVIGQTTDTLTRAFDQATAGLNADDELSPVLPYGNDFVIGKIKARYKGSPVEFETVRPQLQGAAAQINGEFARNQMVQMLEQKGLVKINPSVEADTHSHTE